MQKLAHDESMQIELPGGARIALVVQEHGENVIRLYVTSRAHTMRIRPQSNNSIDIEIQ